jgi:hypothetical protein
MADPSGPQRRAAVVSRHPTTLRQVTQALGVAGLTMRQAIGPAFLPRSALGEFEVVVVDLDIDPEAAPASILEQVGVACPSVPVMAIAGINTRQRLVQALCRGPVLSPVTSIVPKIGSWVESASASGPPTEGADEQELGVALRRLVHPTPIPQGPAPYLLGGTQVEERLLGSSADKDTVLADLLAYAGRFGLSDEKLRRIEVIADELLLNAIYDAPRDENGTPKYANVDRRQTVTLGVQAQVRLRFGCDARSFVVSVTDRFGALTRQVIAAHVARMLEAHGPRPRHGTGGAGLGLVLVYTSSNQLIIHGSPGRFTEVSAVVHVAGSNRAAVARGSALHLYL